MKASGKKHGRYRHGHNCRGKESRTYRSWTTMKDRCLNPNHVANDRYRNVKICRRWLNFKNFLADMGKRPRGKSLDRINGRKGYSPSNCRWASSRVQGQNKVNAIFLVVDGKKDLLKTWAKKSKVPYLTAYRRFYKGWSTEKILSNKSYRGIYGRNASELS